VEVRTKRAETYTAFLLNATRRQLHRAQYISLTAYAERSRSDKTLILFERWRVNRRFERDISYRVYRLGARGFCRCPPFSEQG
jgi:hypothetical protein